RRGDEDGRGQECDARDLLVAQPVGGEPEQRGGQGETRQPPRGGEKAVTEMHREEHAQPVAGCRFIRNHGIIISRREKRNQAARPTGGAGCPSRRRGLSSILAQKVHPRHRRSDSCCCPAAPPRLSCTPSTRGRLPPPPAAAL